MHISCACTIGNYGCWPLDLSSTVPPKSEIIQASMPNWNSVPLITLLLGVEFCGLIVEKSGSTIFIRENRKIELPLPKRRLHHFIFRDSNQYINCNPGRNLTTGTAKGKRTKLHISHNKISTQTSGNQFYNPLSFIWSPSSSSSWHAWEHPHLGRHRTQPGFATWSTIL